MAEKDNKPKTTAKPASTVKPAAKPVTKSTATAKPAATVKPVAKSSATAKPAATVKPVTKPTATAKPAGKATVIDAKPAAKPATTVKPAAKPTASAKPVATTGAKPAATTAPAQKPAATTKPAAKPEPAKQTQVKKPAAAAAVTAPKGAAKTASAPAEQKPKKAAATAAKPEKTKKQPKDTAKKSGGKGGAVAALANNKVRVIIIAAVAFVLVLALILGIVFSAKSCNKGGAGGGNGAITIPIPNNNNYAAAGDLQPGDEYEAVSAGTETFFPESSIKESEYDTTFVTNTQVGYSSRVIGEVDRIIPQKTRDEGLGAYPKFGYTLSTVVGEGDDKAAMRAALIDESDYLTAYGTRNNSGNGNNGDGTYTWMDENGFLYRGTTAEPVAATDDSGMPRRLYKHSASVGMYYEGFGNMPMLSDEEPAIIKEVTIRPRGYGSYSVTGVYAPAGEVIKIQISEEDMNATGGITIHIGQALYNGQSNNIWVAKGQMQRFPNILNTMNVNKQTATLENGVYTAYVGSFIGGPLYIRNTLASFTATISGGVAYPHFILGVTTKEEFEADRQSTAPYFDLEVWHNGVLHSGPRYFAEKYSYEDIYNAAVLWDKVASVTTTNSNQGIVFLYDPFVAAGAAVAFPGRSSVNCPAGWMDGSLNYNGIVSSGSWGNFHEYHHNFQGYGVGNGGEVTNNGMTLVSYAEFTKISSKRGITAYGGQGLGGWNNYTSATWALNDLLSLQRGGHPSNGDQGLAIYATLLHNYGSDNYIQAKVKQQQGGYGQSYAGYFRAWEAQTHNDMTYFFKDVLKGLTGEVAAQWHNAEYTSMFVPVSSVYQTGRSYLYNGAKKYFKTMQPYVVPYESSFTLDLSKYSAPDSQYASGSIVIPEGFTYTVKSVAPAKGTVERIDDLHYRYNFSGSDALSGEIKVTLGITKDDGAFTVDDVELIIELERSHETNKMTLERTTYTYSPEAMYTDAVAAYEAGFAGYTGKSEWAHSNPTQNANTDIWFYNDGNASSFPNADPEKHKIKDNVIEVIDGKLYFEDAGKYRIYLRGRKNCAVYYSLDGGQTYELGAKVTNGSGAAFYVNNPETYFDVELDENSWVYTKEVLIVQTADSSYIGLGYGAWTETMFSMAETYHKADGKEVESTDDENYAYTILTYRDYQGNEVAYARRDRGSDHIDYFKKVGATYVASTLDEISELTEPRLIAPARATYVNAYRRDYQFPDNSGFKTDYFYTRKYNYNYEGTPEVLTAPGAQTYMSEISNYRPWNDDNNTFNVQNLFDNDPSTTVHTYNTFYLSEAQPAILAFDMGKEITANSLTMTVYPGGNGGRAFPKILTLEGSLDGENWFEMGKWSTLSAGANSGKALAFPDKQFRYFKITVPKSNYDITERFALSDLSLAYTTRLTGDGNNVINPTGEKVTLSNGWKSIVSASTFGHLVVGKAGDTATFEFTGTRLAILTSDAHGRNFDVYIDGHKVVSRDIVPHSGVYGITYVSEKLTSGTHNVEIRCTGEANIDSFAIYNEQ